MKFLIENNNKIGQQELLYLEDECSFYTEYTGIGIDVELIVNKIALQASESKIVDLSGFCGLNKSMKSNFKVPESQKGILKVIDDLEGGIGSYSVNKEDLPVYVNTQTGWVCIGNPEKKGNAVEFIKNCVAVIDDDKELVSLWLKPKRLPNI
ncbi:hypothetical protein [Dyadobacter bucti]|uniref:hypothetical protein n=1 Tax=Dyadobacter bucti TaxID=2572203 RepID=UPI001109EC30|nr:hypothetical protein [Dyadobacter bucti]